uniref:Nucleophosmin n=2 Tax=Meleagris gallopavo TaxID=9103 RepID=A0A803Y0H0_MELGA
MLAFISLPSVSAYCWEAFGLGGWKLANFISNIPTSCLVVGDNVLFFFTNSLAFTIVNEVGILNITNILSALEEEPESEDEEEDTKIVNASTKRPASGGGAKTPQKKAKLSEDDEDDDEDEDDDDDDEDDLDDDEEEVKTPMKKPAREPAGKNMQKAKQNGKDSKPSTPASKTKTPDSKKDKSLTPKTPKVPLSLEEIKAKMQASVDKGCSLPKLEPKFANYVKNCFRTEDQKVIQALWQWRQSLV